MRGGYRGRSQSAVVGVDVIVALIVFFPTEPPVFMYHPEHIFPVQADRTEGDVTNHWADMFAGFV